VPETSSLKVRLIHDGKQPGPSVPEPLDFGIQDKMGVIHPGKASKGRLLHFEIDIAVKHADAPLFSGPFVHGPPAGRFLYLSWKKHGQHEHPWAWRIKMALGVSRHLCFDRPRRRVISLKPMLLADALIPAIQSPGAWGHRREAGLI
jgi:hypothetical protein